MYENEQSWGIRCTCKISSKKGVIRCGIKKNGVLFGVDFPK